MIKKYKNQYQTVSFNNLNNYESNNQYKKANNTLDTKNIFTINDIINNKLYLESEKNAMMKMYTEIISVMINQHFK